MRTRYDEQPTVDVSARVVAGVDADGIDQEIGTAEFVVGKETGARRAGLDGQRRFLDAYDVGNLRLSRLEAGEESIMELVPENVGSFVRNADLPLG